MKNSEKKKTKLIKHLRKYGSIGKACDNAGTTRRNYYYWLENKEFKDEVRSAKIAYLVSQWRTLPWVGCLVESLIPYFLPGGFYYE